MNTIIAIAPHGVAGTGLPAAQKRHAPAQILYVWPFDPDRVAGLFADEIPGLTGRQFT